MDKFYKTQSSREIGTIYQLRNKINRKNVNSQVSKDYHADSDFIDLLTDCHILAAALQYLNMDGVESECNSLPKNVEGQSIHEKRRTLMQICGEIVDHYFLNSITLGINRLENGDEDVLQEQDGILNYACNFAKLGFLRKMSVMATKYGDGLRILRHWKYATLLYHQSHKTKYRLEGFLLMAGVNALFTPRQRQQVVHNRFINLKGGEGNNLDGDYVMELLNKYAKSRVRMLGPNHTPEMVDRIGKTMMVCHDIEEKLERQIKVAPISTDHKEQCLNKDRSQILNQLKEAQIFKNIPGRVHQSFQSENMDMFGSIDIKEIHLYINQKKQYYSNKKRAF